MDASSRTAAAGTNAAAAARYRALAAHYRAAAFRAAAAVGADSRSLGKERGALPALFAAVADAADDIAAGFSDLHHAELAIRRLQLAVLDPCSAAEDEATAAAAAATRPT